MEPDLEADVPDREGLPGRRIREEDEEDDRFCDPVLSMTCLLTRPGALKIEPDRLELEGARVGADLRIVDEPVRGVPLV